MQAPLNHNSARRYFLIFEPLIELLRGKLRQVLARASLCLLILELAEVIGEEFIVFRSLAGRDSGL